LALGAGSLSRSLSHRMKLITPFLAVLALVLPIALALLI
jgi:hypothetical protein